MQEKLLVCFSIRYEKIMISNFLNITKVFSVLTNSVYRVIIRDNVAFSSKIVNYENSCNTICQSLF